MNTKGIIRAGLIAGLGAVSASAWATPCDSALSSYESYVSIGDSSNAAYVVSNHPECFAGSPSRSMMMINATSFVLFYRTLQVLALRRMFLSTFAPYMVGDRGVRGMAAGGTTGKWNFWSNLDRNDTRQTYMAANGFRTKNESDVTTIVFGELVPKRIGQLYPEQVSRLIALPMTWVASMAKPFVWLLSACTHGTLKLLRIDNEGSRAVTEAEISASLEEGVDAGVIEEQERQMVQNVFLLDDRPLTSMMLPRSDIKWLDASQSAGEILEQLREGGAKRAFSWYPVCRGSLENVVGTISLGKLIELGSQHTGTIEEHVHAPVFVPETLSGMELLEQFRTKTARMVLVVDEYGDVQGLITPNDMLEAITGELQPYTPVDAWATPRDDGSWLIDGAMPVGEFKSRLDIDDLPDEERGRYNTVAGLLMAVSGTLPVEGERIDCAGWSFEVVDLDGRRIDKVLATRMTPEQIADSSYDT